MKFIGVTLVNKSVGFKGSVGFSSTIHDLYNVLCAYHPKSSLLEFSVNVFSSNFNFYLWFIIKLKYFYTFLFICIPDSMKYMLIYFYFK